MFVLLGVGCVHSGFPNQVTVTASPVETGANLVAYWRLGNLPQLDAQPPQYDGGPIAANENGEVCCWRASCICMAGSGCDLTMFHAGFLYH